MFPSKPLIDLATAIAPYDSNDTTTLPIILGLWCLGWMIFYFERGSWHDELNYLAFMAVLTPTLMISFSSGFFFWSLVIMTVINISIWIYTI